LTIQKQRRSSLRLVTSDATEHLLANCTPIAVTLTTQPVNSVRRMMMTLKQTLQATLVGLILSVPFLIEIAKELLK
jgi:ABC-type phosphate/phosphonate transport system permease subunit